MRGVSAFQSTLPARGATSVSVTAVLVLAFQSTLPARGATRKDGKTVEADKISIHAPRTGSDAALQEIKAILLEISIHAPRTGSDHHWERVGMGADNFNPRSPHGERLKAAANRHAAGYFNPRSPHGERRAGGGVFRHALIISIHAPRTGSDASRPRARPRLHPISIHAPRTGSDRVFPLQVIASGAFQSTLPARGATSVLAGILVYLLISIHAPRTGSDARA